MLHRETFNGPQNKGEYPTYDVKHTRLFGIEVEAECAREPDWSTYPDGFPWVTDQDASLRGAYNLEVKSARPENRLWFNKNLPVLLDFIFTEGQAVETVRASTHIHMNMIGANKIHIANFLCMYYLLEDLLVETVGGPGRKGNLYCLGLSDAENGAEVLRSLLNDNMNWYHRQEEVKYSAMNFETLFRFGTLEFRALKTTRDCTNVLDCMRLFIRMMKMMGRWEKPTSIIEFMSFNGAERLVKELVPDSLYKRMESHTPSYDTVLTVQHLFYGVNYE